MRRKSPGQGREQQSFDAPTQLHVTGTGLIEVGGPLLTGRLLECRQINLVDAR
jgi:hypothetical protein